MKRETWLWVGLGFGAYTLSSTMPQYYAATLVWTIGDVVGLPLVSAVVASMSPVDLRGRYQGTQLLAQALATARAPPAQEIVAAISRYVQTEPYGID